MGILNDLRTQILCLRIEGILTIDQVIQLNSSNRPEKIISVLEYYLRYPNLNPEKTFYKICLHFIKSEKEGFETRELLFILILLSNEGVINKKQLINYRNKFVTNYSLDISPDYLISLNLVQKISLQEQIIYRLSFPFVVSELQSKD